jgi:hypothetical protein
MYFQEHIIFFYIIQNLHSTTHQKVLSLIAQASKIKEYFSML